MIRTSNPALNDKVFTGERRTAETAGVMTLDGTVNKALISIAITTATGYWAWVDPTVGKMGVVAALAGFVVALIIAFKHSLAPLLTPVYAAAEGIFLGGLSLYFETIYPGIVFQAISLTFGAFICLLTAYKSGMIRPSENFKLGLVAATGAIGVVYLISFGLSLFGVGMPFLHSSSPISIAISVVVVIIAALNLVLDFDFIENATASGRAPAYMEWYGAFGLLVTLVWLYLEVLRLLAKLNSRD